MDVRTLAVIPARGGSKRLPRKNIKCLNGHPLIAYTIEAAKNSNTLTDFVVSSDDEEIISVARKYGAPVPFVRPKEIATDETRNNATLMHALKWMEGYNKIKYDLVMLLQPTCPIRDHSHIDLAIKLLAESNCDTLASVKGPFVKRHPTLKRLVEGRIKNYAICLDNSNEPFFIYNAAIYAARRNYFVEQNSFFSSEQIPLFMGKVCSQDIDELLDFQIVEMIMKTYSISLKEPYTDERD
jgi:CMP-N,N'-diacetyllegionaminic acid synthase